MQSFRKNTKVIMTTDEKIKDKKLQFDIKREAAKNCYYHHPKLINMNNLQVNKINFQSKSNDRTS